MAPSDSGNRMGSSGNRCVWASENSYPQFLHRSTRSNPRYPHFGHFIEGASCAFGLRSKRSEERSAVPECLPTVCSSGLLPQRNDLDRRPGTVRLPHRAPNPSPRHRRKVTGWEQFQQADWKTRSDYNIPRFSNLQQDNAYGKGSLRFCRFSRSSTSVRAGGGKSPAQSPRPPRVGQVRARSTTLATPRTVGVCSRLLVRHLRSRNRARTL